MDRPWNADEETFPPARERALIEEFVNQRTWAVVGASSDREKYGNRVFRALRDAGYSVFPVNPNEAEIEEHRAYPALRELPLLPDVVNIVVPPAIGMQIVEQCEELDIHRVWFQPGAESRAAIEYCRQHDIAVVFDHCAMHHSRQWPSQAEV